MHRACRGVCALEVMRSPTPKTASRVLRFELESSDSDATDTPALPCTPRQALRLGEILATELEQRTMEPLVTS